MKQFISSILPLKTKIHLGRVMNSRSIRKWRPSWLKNTLIVSEGYCHPHVKEEKADLFIVHNSGSTEVEVLNWLHATICLTKANAILETGAYDGMGTIALASACRDNGFGKVHSVEISPDACARLDQTLRKHGLREWVEIHEVDSLKFLNETNIKFDLGFFDSLVSIRASEYQICRERGILDGPAIFHDTSALRCDANPEESVETQAQYREDVRRLAETYNDAYFENPLSRGIIALFPPAKTRISSETATR